MAVSESDRPQGDPSWEQQSTAGGSRYKAARRPTLFRTGPTTEGLGGGGTTSPSCPSGGEHDRVECQLCPCGLSRGAGEARKGRKQDKFAKRPKRPSGWWEEAPGYPW